MKHWNSLTLLLIFTSVMLTCASLSFGEAKKGDAAKSKTKKTATKSKASLSLISTEGVIIQKDVAYLEPERAEKLDLYLPANRAKETRSPAVVIIHGGGWSGGIKDATREIQLGTELARAGYVCASVEYQKAAGKRWPTNVQDCKNAVRFLRANAEKYQVDVDHFGTIGGSAGGHLALMVGYTNGVKELEPAQPYPGVSDKVQCCVDMYGITNLLTLVGTEPDGTPNGVFRSFGLFQEPREEQPEKWKLASPVYHINKTTPPTLILHGTADTTVDRDQATELDKKLKEGGVEHTLMMIEGAKHTFLINEKNRDLRPVLIGFFDKHLKPGKK